MAREMTAKRHEFIAVLVLTVALLLLVCLVSYDARDSSFNALSYKLRADNMAGKIGAHVSDFLFQLFGYSAYLLLCPRAGDTLSISPHSRLPAYFGFHRRYSSDAAGQAAFHSQAA
jgi:hypothetical protein